MTMNEESIPAGELKDRFQALKANIEGFIRGKSPVIDQVLTCFLAGGHLLLEDLPGLGKTTLAYCLSKSVELDFRRIQFTSDLLPSDVVGLSIYDESVRAFVFQQGPVFTNILLADEINRSTPKTQSALLEVMDRGKATVEGHTYEVGRPFMVFATQNPIENVGTFPLPESQMDRFLMRLNMGFAAFEDELQILRSKVSKYDELELPVVMDAASIRTAQACVRDVYIEDSVLRYLLKIVSATRTEAEFSAGISTRGSIALRSACQAAALYDGRSYVLPEDVRRLVVPVLAHRLSLRRDSRDSQDERHAIEGILQRIVDSIPSPE